MLFRWFIILALTFLSIIGISPTIDYYSNYFGNDSLSEEQLYKSNDLKDKSLTLGLDLQGGMHMVLELDIVDLYKNLINDEYKNSFQELDQFEKELVKINTISTSLNFIDNLFLRVFFKNSTSSSGLMEEGIKSE